MKYASARASISFVVCLISAGINANSFRLPRDINKLKPQHIKQIIFSKKTNTLQGNTIVLKGARFHKLCGFHKNSGLVDLDNSTFQELHLLEIKHQYNCARGFWSVQISDAVRTSFLKKALDTHRKYNEKRPIPKIENNSEISMGLD